MAFAACERSPLGAPDASSDEGVALQAAMVLDGRPSDEFEAVGHMCAMYDDMDQWIGNPFYAIVDGWLCFPGAVVLVAPDVALTFAHIRPFFARIPPTKVAATFDADFASGAPKFEGTFIDNPAWDFDNPGANDVAMLVLNDPVSHITPARLPRWIGEVDRIVQPGETRATLVGFGLTSLDNWPDAPDWGLKHVGRTRIGELHPGYVTTTQRLAGESSGCYGDSGSSMFRGSGRTNTLWATGGNAAMIGPECSYMGYSRLDTEAVREFLSAYVPANLLPRGSAK